MSYSVDPVRPPCQRTVAKNIYPIGIDVFYFCSTIISKQTRRTLLGKKFLLQLIAFFLADIPILFHGF